MNVLIMGGGGNLGSATAQNIAIRGLAETVFLLDVNQDAAEYHAMDMDQAVYPITGTRVKPGKWENLRECGLLIIAAGLPAASTTHDSIRDIVALMPLIREISDAVHRYNPSVVVLSMTNPLDLFNYVLYKTAQLPAKQFIALSYNDSHRFRYAIAECLGCSPKDVQCTVVGEHGKNKVHLFSTVRINGFPHDFSHDEKTEILNFVDSWWARFLRVSSGKAAAWTTSVSAGDVAEYILGRKKGPVCCSVIDNDSDSFSMGWPVLLDGSGVASVCSPDLDEDEKKQVLKVREIMTSMAADAMAAIAAE